MIKSSGRFPKRFDLGHLSDYGNYEECFQSSISIEQIHPQYCLVSAVPDFEKLRKLNISDFDVDRIFRSDYDVLIGRFLEIGLCVISSCSSTDISKIFMEGKL